MISPTCPFCSSEAHPSGGYVCRTAYVDGSPDPWESAACILRQRDQQRLRIAALETHIETLLVRGDVLDDLVDAPDANCSCHLSPPCNDCLNYGAIREAKADWKEARGRKP